MNKETAEFVGVMLGDGSIGIYNTRAGNKQKIHRRVKTTLDSRDKGYIDHVKNLMRQVLSVEPRVCIRKDQNAVDISTHKKDALSYTLNTIGLKLSPKWGSMIIPDKFLSEGWDLLVLKGLFDTDGCLALYRNNGQLYPRIEIRLSPCPAQEQINFILEKHHFSYRVQKLERGKTRVRISGKAELRKWFDLIGSSNPIHLNKAKPFLE